MGGGEAEKKYFLLSLHFSQMLLLFFFTLISLIAARFKMQGIERHTLWAMLQDLR